MAHSQGPDDALHGGADADSGCGGAAPAGSLLPSVRHNSARPTGQACCGRGGLPGLRAQRTPGQVHSTQPRSAGSAEILPTRNVVFTNADANHARRVLHELEIERYFVGIVDVNRMDPYCKPSPEAFGIALAAAGEEDPSQCVMIDDLPHTTRGGVGFWHVRGALRRAGSRRRGKRGLPGLGATACGARKGAVMSAVLVVALDSVARDPGGEHHDRGRLPTGAARQVERRTGARAGCHRRTAPTRSRTEAQVEVSPGLAYRNST